MSQQATVIAGFPGIGKSYFTDHNVAKSSSLRVYNFLDLDSNPFSHTHGIPNPSFPLNYIAHIRNDLLQIPDLVILVGVHDVVRDQMVANGINFTLVYPEQGLKGEYMKRWIERGSPGGLVRKLDSMWDVFTGSCANQNACRHVILQEGVFLADVMEGILRDEGKRR